jgi:hypothetical protein
MLITLWKTLCRDLKRGSQTALDFCLTTLKKPVYTQDTMCLWRPLAVGDEFQEFASWLY